MIYYNCRADAGDTATRPLFGSSDSSGSARTPLLTNNLSDKSLHVFPDSEW